MCSDLDKSGRELWKIRLAHHFNSSSKVENVACEVVKESWVRQSRKQKPCFSVKAMEGWLGATVGTTGGEARSVSPCQ